MGQSMIYIYLAVVMLLTSATAYYVRTVKQKLDTKVDAMFQLVQSMAKEINALKTSSACCVKEEEVIQLDLNSNNSDNKIVVSDSEYQDSDSDSEEENDSEQENDSEENNDSEEESVTDFKLTTEPVLKELEVTKVDVELPIELEGSEIKEVQIEPLEEQNYEQLTVKELKELVSAKGGKIAGKKKSELIAYLSE